MKTKAQRVISWIILNGLMAYAVYFCYQGSTVAENIITFFIPAMAVIYFFGSMSDEVKAKMAVKGRSVPAEVSTIYDLILCAAIAGLGWYWIAFFVLVSAMSEAAIYGDNK